MANSISKSILYSLIVISILILTLIKYSQADDINKLLQSFYKENYYEHQKAIESLVKIGAPAVEPLINALKNENFHVRASAATTLGKIKDTRAVGPLIVALKDKHEHVRSSAADALGEIKDNRAIKPLIDALDNPNIVRMGASDSLVNIGSPAVEPLIATLKDNKNFEVRSYVAMTLGKIKDVRAIKPLIDAMRDDQNSFDVRDVSSNSLGNFGAPAVEQLITALKDKNRYVREGAANALGIIKDVRAIEPLIKVLKNEKDAMTNREAEDSLVEIGSDAVKPLIAALKEEDDLKFNVSVANTLGRIGKGAVAELIDTINYNNLSVRWLTAWALEITGDTKAKKTVNHFLKNTNLSNIAKNYVSIINSGDSEKIYHLILALERHGNKDMAVDFLNCGNQLLERKRVIGVKS